MTIPMTVAVSAQAVPMTVGAAYSVGGEIYEGPTEFTPGDEEQTANTANRLLLDNITIAAIPSNYGKITWSGNILTVS